MSNIRVYPRAVIACIARFTGCGSVLILIVATNSCTVDLLSEVKRLVRAGIRCLTLNTFELFLG